MPALLEKHRSDVDVAQQLRRERLDSSNKESTRRTETATGVSDSDDNNVVDDNPDTPSASQGEKQKRIVAPRKKFDWTPLLRLVLFHF